MTALIVQATPFFIELAKPVLQNIYQQFLHGFDRFAEAMMRRAIPARLIHELPGEAYSFAEFTSAGLPSPERATFAANARTSRTDRGE